jgi:hypothetical protein
MIVQMVRRLTDKKNPEVICESKLNYKLPQELMSLIADAAEVGGEEMSQYCYTTVNEHLTEEFGGTGFFPVGMIDDE